ncbi:uncharacterized protein LOC110467142 [Mizuhopecten yessoensis]|nr:uncharacterized protein LOC110467142 [Mizuhopecten yessoensis]
MSGLTFLCLYAGLLYHTTNVLSIPLSQDVRDAIDDYISQKQHFLSKDVQILTSRLAKVENNRENDFQFFTNRLLEVETMHAKELETLTNRLAEVENMCNKDFDILTSGIPEVENMRSKELQAQINRSSDVEKMHGKHDVKGLTNRLKDLKNNNFKDVKTLKTHSQTFQAPSIAKRTSIIMRPRVAPVTDWVAFHAILPVRIHDPAYGHIIPFSDMKTNIGTGYHATTGVFICNTPGVYVFSWNIRIHEPAHGLETELMLNGATVGYNTSGGGDNSVWGYGSATVTLYLQEGDEVWVRVTSKTPGVSIVEYNCMFTGFLIHT